MSEIFELRRQLADQRRTNEDLNQRLVAAEAELREAQKHREALAETQRQSQLESQASAEIQGRVKPGLEKQFLTILRGEGLLAEIDGKLALRTPGEWQNSVPISERIDGILGNYSHFRNQEQPEPAASDRSSKSYENLRATKDILKACSELDEIHRQQQKQRYEDQMRIARPAFQEGVPTPTRGAKTLSPQEVRRRLFEEQRKLS